MPPVEESLDRVPKMAWLILQKALSQGCGHWEGATHFTLDEVDKEWFPPRALEELEAALASLIKEGFLLRDDADYGLTERGYEAASTVGDRLLEDPAAHLEEPVTAPEGVPFKVENPCNTRWTLTNTFEQDLGKLDRSLWGVASKEMEQTLAYPKRGKPLRNELHGIWQAKFNRRYRLRWCPKNDGSVEFRRIGHKNDM